MQPNILINNRTGGIAETNTLMREGDCAYMENLDGRSDPICLKMNTAVETVSTTGSGIGVGFAQGRVFCDNGEIYSLGLNTLQHTIPGQILSVSKFAINDATYPNIILGLYRSGSSVYCFVIPLNVSGTPQYGLTVNNYGTTYNSITNTSSPFAELTNNNASYIVNYEDYYLYFTVGKKVFAVNQQFCTSTGGRIELALTLEDDIVGMTRSGYTMNIYLRNGLKYFRQGIKSRNTTGSFDTGVKYIGAVGTSGSYDYIVGGGFTGEDSSLYVSQGQSIQKLKDVSFIKDGVNTLYKFSCGTNVCQNQFYLSGVGTTVYIPTESLSRGGLLSFGKKNEIVPNTWIHEYIAPSLTVGAVAVNADINPDNSVFFCVEGSVRKMTLRADSTPSYQSSGVWYTKKYNSPVARQMTSVRMRFRYNSPVNTSIQLFYAVDGSNTFQSLGTLPNGRKDFESLEISRATKPRYEIQFKIVMTTSDTSVTPELYTLEEYSSNAGKD